MITLGIILFVAVLQGGTYGALALLVPGWLDQAPESQRRGLVEQKVGLREGALML